jgi:hypothetical protein
MSSTLLCEPTCGSFFLIVKNRRVIFSQLLVVHVVFCFDYEAVLSQWFMGVILGQQRGPDARFLKLI